MNSLVRFYALIFLLAFSTVSNGEDSLFAANSNPLSSSDTEFLKVEDAYQLLPRIENDQLLLDWQIAPGYYLYQHRFQLLFADSLQKIPSPTRYQPGKKIYDEYFQKELEVYYLQTQLSAPLSGLPDSLVVESQACADAGLCYPPRKQLVSLDRSTNTASVLNFTGPLQAPAEPVKTPESSVSLMVILLFSLLGGLILNLMPCVFPVLSIKALSLTTSHLNNHSKHLHGLAYTLGIVLSFVAIAAALLALRASGEALGWGFQLQSPIFIGALVYLFVLMGLSFSGFFQFGTRLMNIGQSTTQGSSLQSSFMTGVLATVVASPCTAPFMGTALGVALTQPSAVSLLIFATLGLGMALPFLLLSWWPSLSKLLPKPGAWMETFKEFLAFPLYLSAVWLLWVLGRQTDMNTVAAVIVGIILISFAIWVTHSRNGRHPARLALSIAALLLSVAIPLSVFYDRDTPDNWEAFSTERLRQLRQDNQAVFVNLTADWCITCLANESVALNTAEVQDAFSQNNVYYLKGDWTNYNKEITDFLNQHGRSGVPLYLFYGKDKAAPALLPQLLTTNIIIDIVNGK